MDGESRTHIVPIQSTRCEEVLAVATWARPAGGRVGIMFTTVDRLVAAMGDEQQWIPISESALRAMLRPLGIKDIEVDPVMVRPRVPLPPRVQTGRRLATVGATS
jgi:hypothetical protein